MRTRLASLVAAALVAAALVAAPAVAQTPAEEPAGTEAPATGEPVPPGEEAPLEEGEHEEEGVKREFPLDLEDDEGIVGLVFLLISGAVGLFALRTFVKQLRGDRPQASGGWRPR